MSGKRIRSYPGSELTVRYDADRCIHAAECVRGLNRVFNPDASPWITPDGASADEVAAVIDRCPSGALSHDLPAERRKTAPAVPVPAELSICAGGPVYVHGEVVLVTPDGEPAGHETRLALCRCGASAHKPFCDDSHRDALFSDPGGIDRQTGDVPASVGPLTLTPLPNGPVLLRGPFVLTSADGSCEFRGDKAALCRCGASANKPFCDGAHARIGFQADGAAS